MKIILAFLAFVLIAFTQPVSADSEPVVEIYHGQECPHCQRLLEWLPALEVAYPEADFKVFEVWHNAENQAQMMQRGEDLSVQFTGVPLVIVGEAYVIGNQPEAILDLLTVEFGEPLIDRSELLLKVEASEVVVPESTVPKNNALSGSLLQGIGAGALVFLLAVISF